MIYAISEFIATILENIIFFIFLIATLSFKPTSRSSKMIGTALFFILQCVAVFTLNRFYAFEGLLIMINILLLFVYCRIMLQGSFWYQSIVVLLAFACLFSINIAVTTVTNLIAQGDSNEILTFQSPIRIFLLFITKLLLCFTLILISSFFKSGKIPFDKIQCFSMLSMLLITLLVGVILERLQLQNTWEDWECILIVGSLITINLLLFFILYQFSLKNKMKVKEAVLRVQLESEQQKIQDSIRWNTEMEKLQHDLKNHLFLISSYIKNHEFDRALQYIANITGEIEKEIPHHAATTHPAFNAILDLKSKICRENHIDLKCFILKEIPDFDDMDLCVILSNLFDNAIEAEKKEQERGIKLAITIVGNYLRITMENRISQSVLTSNQSLTTTKSDKKAHGIGLQSVADAVQRNDGMQEFYEENGWFAADVMVKVSQNYENI